MEHDQFGKLLDLLATVSYIDLRDLLDLFAVDHAGDNPEALADARRRRRGKPTVTLAAVETWAHITPLKPRQQRHAEQVIDLLYNAMKPKARRRRAAIGDSAPAARPPIARGSVTVKTIPRRRNRIEADGSITTETIYYRYVYIQMTETAGGLDGVQTHQRSIYIRQSRGLAFALDTADPDDRAALKRRILDAYHDRTLDQLVGQYAADDGQEADQQ